LNLRTRTSVFAPLVPAVIAALLLAPVLSGCRRSTAETRPPSAVLPETIRLIDTQEGWGFTRSAVLHTTDGGATWYDVTPKDVRTKPPAPSGKPLAGEGPLIAGAEFLDSEHAWLAVANEGRCRAVYRTADGGKSWGQASIDLPSVGVQIQFLDADRGWIMVHEGVAAGSEEVAILRSVDGGASWTVINAGQVNGAPVPGSLPFGGDKTGFAFSDARHGWVTGYQPVEGRAFLYVTDDGGVTFRPADLALPRAYARSWVSTWPPVFLSATDGLLPVVFGAPGQPTVFYRTHDGGKTWEPGAALISPTNDRFVWSFADVKHGFATDGGRLYATADGGATWAEVRTEESLAGLRQLQFVSDQVGWAVGDGRLIKTVDGGQTWGPPKPGR